MMFGQRFFSSKNLYRGGFGSIVEDRAERKSELGNGDAMKCCFMATMCLCNHELTSLLLPSLGPHQTKPINIQS